MEETCAFINCIGLHCKNKILMNNYCAEHKCRNCNNISSYNNPKLYCKNHATNHKCSFGNCQNTLKDGFDVCEKHLCQNCLLQKRTIDSILCSICKSICVYKCEYILGNGKICNFPTILCIIEHQNNAWKTKKICCNHRCCYNNCYDEVINENEHFCKNHIHKCNYSKEPCKKLCCIDNNYCTGHRCDLCEDCQVTIIKTYKKNILKKVCFNENIPKYIYKNKKTDSIKLCNKHFNIYNFYLFEHV